VKLFDTCVLIDAFDPQSPWHDKARAAIALAVGTEGGAVNPVALAEAGANAEQPARVAADLEAFGLELIPLPVAVALPVAAAWRAYLDNRKASSSPPAPKTPLPDFFIGAHAAAAKLSLVTRDPARIKTYFAGVTLEVL